MRAKVTPPRPEGTERIIKKFLLFPRTINNELRWLETARIRQRWTRVAEIDMYCHIYTRWVDIDWVDDFTQ